MIAVTSNVTIEVTIQPITKAAPVKSESESELDDSKILSNMQLTANT